MVRRLESIHGRSSQRARLKTILALLLTILCGLAFFSAGCATPDLPAKRFSDILNRYPPSEEPLRIKKLTASSNQDIIPAKHGRAVTVMVHPAYSLFFREERGRSRYSEAKYDLLEFQFDSEARFISAIAMTDNILVLVLPGNFQQESIAPLSYVTYLNTAAGNGQSVYYITSEPGSSGALSMDSMVTLYAFLHQIKAGKVLIGGGYIGRCQRDFYDQTAVYREKVSAYIVPEISTISPDDISTRESSEILDSLRRKDYTPIRQFIEKKTGGAAGILQMPGVPAL